MATSGTYDFTMTASEFLDSVLRLSNVVGEGENANAEEYKIATEALNLQLHQLEVNDVPIWKRGFYDVKPSQSSYVTNDSVDYRCVKGHTAAAENEPGTGDLWMEYWTADIDAEGTPTTWALTTVYTTSIEVTIPDRFYDILVVTVIQNSSNETPIRVIPFDVYTMDVNSKRTSVCTNIPTYISFDNNTTNVGYLYPQPTNAFTSSLRIYGIVKPEDVDATNQNIDIPPRYLNMLRYNVALDIAYSFGQDPDTIQLLKGQANYFLKEYRKSNKEHTTANFSKGAYSCRRK